MSRLCDFCSSPATWVHPADSFQVKGSVVGSEGAWLACDECHELIESDQRDALVNRVVQVFTAKYPSLEENYTRQYASQLHGQFFVFRRGASRPL